VGAQRDGLDQVTFEDFVTGFHVTENVVVKQVGYKGQDPIGNHVPIKDGTACAAQKAGAIDNIRDAFFDRLEEGGILTGVIFKISILDDDNIPDRVLDARADSGTFAQIPGVGNDLNCRSF